MNLQKVLAVLGVTALAVVTLVGSRADDGKEQSAAGPRRMRLDGPIPTRGA